MSDTHETDFACVRRRRAPPAHAHDAPFTHGHARIPDIAPPKWFRARSNATSLVLRARQALLKRSKERMGSVVCRRDGDRATCWPRQVRARGASAVLVQPARVRVHVHTTSYNIVYLARR